MVAGFGALAHTMRSVNATYVLRCYCSLSDASIAELKGRGLYRAAEGPTHLLAINAENHQSAIGQGFHAIEQVTSGKCVGLNLAAVELASEPPE